MGSLRDHGWDSNVFVGVALGRQEAMIRFLSFSISGLSKAQFRFGPSRNQAFPQSSKLAI